MLERLSIIWPLAIFIGVVVGILMSRKRRLREEFLGFPLLAVVILSAAIWTTEVYIALPGFGHFGAGTMAFIALLVGIGAGVLYLVSYLLTRAVADKASKQRGPDEPTSS